MTGFRPRLAPTLITVPAVLILLGLGVWQVQRLQWKEGLIAQRDAMVQESPIAPPLTLDEANEFRHVADDGVLLNDKEIYLAASSDSGESGYEVLTPLREAGGRVIFVNRGFIPLALKDPSKRAAGELSGMVHIAGLLRVAPAEKPTFFLPDNRPDLDLWFWVDLPAMARAAGVSGLAPFYIDADTTPNPGGWPKGGITRLELPNDHLQYAITWFCLAIALVVIYFVYHDAAGRRRRACRTGGDPARADPRTAHRAGYCRPADRGRGRSIRTWTLAARESARNAAALAPCRGGAGRSGSGSLTGVLGLRSGVAGGATGQ
jgi:surfeit locus 1 family protein